MSFVALLGVCVSSIQTKILEKAPKEYMSHVDANSCYLRGECATLSLMPDKMPTGWKRVIANTKWGTVVKYIHKPRGRRGGKLVFAM
jgi:hypothetical protein